MDAGRTLMSLVHTQRASVGSKKSAEKQGVRQARVAVAMGVRIADLTQGKVKPKDSQKNVSVSLIERVILSAGAMLIFSVSFQMTKCPKAKRSSIVVVIYPRSSGEGVCLRRAGTRACAQQQGSRRRVACAKRRQGAEGRGEEFRDGWSRLSRC